MPGFYLPSENEFDPSTDDFVLPIVSKERKYKHFDLPLRACSLRLDGELIVDAGRLTGVLSGFRSWENGQGFTFAVIVAYPLAFTDAQWQEIRT